MKVETILLKTLFAAVVFTCVLTMGAFVTTSAPQLPSTAIAAAR